MASSRPRFVATYCCRPSEIDSNKSSSLQHASTICSGNPTVAIRRSVQPESTPLANAFNARRCVIQILKLRLAILPKSRSGPSNSLRKRSTAWTHVGLENMHQSSNFFGLQRLTYRNGQHCVIREMAAKHYSKATLFNTVLPTETSLW